MEKLLAAIFDLISNTPTEKIRQLAACVHELPGPVSAEKLNTWPMNPDAKTRVDRLTAAWRASGILPAELSGMLLAANYAYLEASSASHTELIWTGPSTELVPTRKTEQALIQVINGARARLFLTSFIAYDVAPIMTALARAAERGVALSMLLESSDKHGGGVSVDGIARMRKAFPSARVYFWKDKGEEFSGGKVHAKVAVSDEKLCFISSANLTGYAMEKNMEAGVLVRGGALPRTLHRHLEALVTVKIVQA